MKFARLFVITALVLVLSLVTAIPSGSAPGERAETTSDDQSGIAITIYNDGTGLVKDTREIDLPDGEFELIFMDVASTIDATSVHFVSNTNPDALAVLEQNYEYDLVSTAALYNRHIDQHISVRTEDGRTIEGTLLSHAGGMVINTADGIVIVNNPVEVTFEALPEGLITRPTLKWLLASNRSGTHECEMSYLASGMRWYANYVVIVGENDDVLDLSGWVTIDNNSGASYYDAMLKLVAGEVHRVQPEYRYEYDYPVEAYYDEAMPLAAPGFEEESFFEYHLYTLQRPATVLNNQQKQISLLEGEGIGVTKLFVFDPGYSYWNRGVGDTAEAPIQVRLQFMNSEENSLGVPLPKGVLRVYKEDSSGALQFIGEDRIDHTPRDEEIEIFLGEAFDIVGERVVLDRRQWGSRWEYDVEVTIRNHKDEAVTITYWDHAWGDWEVSNASHEWNQKDASTLEFVFDVPADGETVVTYTIHP